MTEKQNLCNEDLKEVSGGTISYGKYVIIRQQIIQI